MFPPACSGGSFTEPIEAEPSRSLWVRVVRRWHDCELTSVDSAAPGRPVVDQTGLTGRYDFSVQWTMESNSLRVLDAAPEPRGRRFWRR